MSDHGCCISVHKHDTNNTLRELTLNDILSWLARLPTATSTATRYKNVRLGRAAADVAAESLYAKDS